MAYTRNQRKEAERLAKEAEKERKQKEREARAGLDPDGTDLPHESEYESRNPFRKRRTEQRRLKKYIKALRSKLGNYSIEEMKYIGRVPHIISESVNTTKLLKEDIMINFDLVPCGSGIRVIMDIQEFGPQEITPDIAFEHVVDVASQIAASGIDMVVQPYNLDDEHGKDMVAKYGGMEGRLSPDKWCNISFFPKNEEESDLIYKKAVELGREGIYFDTSGTKGVRDWQTDWSFHYTGESNDDREIAQAQAQELIKDIESCKNTEQES